MDGNSLSQLDIKVEELKKIIPEVFSENKIDWEKLQAFFGGNINFSNERYVLNWAGKRDAIRELQKTTSKTLQPCKEDSVNFDDTNHVFIDGDNLDALKILQRSYFNKVKMIYIDPPYNTGKDSFVYLDKFAESKKEYEVKVGDKDDIGNLSSAGTLHTNSKENGQYHSNWLNMIYPRLHLAKNLLKDDGVIFISIDDNEVHNLRMVMNEIFGEENFVAEFIWEKKKKPSFLHKNVGKLSEYILCFIKNNANTFPFSIENTTEGKKYPLNNAGNSINTITFPPSSIKFNIEDCSIQPQDMSKGNIITELLNEVIIKNKTNINAFSLKGEWRYSQNKINELIKNNECIVISQIPFRPNHIKIGGEIKKMKNMFSPFHYKMDTNEDATNEIITLFEKDLFDNPKPSKLIKTLIKSVSYMDSDGIFLDFFAGSGTTGHAVMQLNSEDCGNRKCISVQLPEPTDEKSEAYKDNYKTISEISKERIRRAGKKIEEEIKLSIIKIKEEISKLQEGLGLDDNKQKIKELKVKIKELQKQDLGLKVFKISDSNFKEWRQLKKNTEEELFEQLKLSIDPVAENADELYMVYELLLKNGNDLNSKIEFKNNYWVIEDSDKRIKLVLLLNKVDKDIMNKAISEKPNKIIVLDKLFAGIDKLKSNSAKQVSDANIEFKSI